MAEPTVSAGDECFRCLVEHSCQVTWRAAPDGRFLGRQEGWEQFTGQTLAEYQDFGGLNAVHPEDREAVTRHWRRAIDARSFFEHEYRLRHRNGDYRHVLARGIPVLDHERSVQEWLGSIEDVTDRKRTEQTLRAREKQLATELHAALRLHELSMHLVNGEGVEELFVHVLDTAVAIMHADFASMQMAEPTGKDAQALRLLASRGFHPESAAHWQTVGIDDEASCGAALRDCERVCIGDIEQWHALEGTADLVAYRRSGIRAVQSTPLMSRSGRLLGMISTHWRRPYLPSESELRAFDILARQVADLIERKQWEDSLRERDRRKDEFLATLAHELRNPLAPIRNAAQVLARLRDSDRMVSWSRDVIERQAAHMARLLDDLLDVSRISRNLLQLRKARVTLGSVVEGAIETSHPLIEAGGHELLVVLPSEPIYLEADSVRLAQVFSNLLNNAAKYTPDGGEIRLTAELNGERSNEVIISVKDSGVGIAEDMRPRLFQMFSQGKSDWVARREGLGIGLALAKKLVDMHGGTVSVHSEGQGRGSEFLVRLPIVVGASAEPQQTRSDEPDIITGRRILVVDDNRDAADTLSTLLKLDGTETRTAHDGLECIDMVKAFQPDVVLLDIGLPSLDGYEVCRRIRASPRGEEIVVIALSGWGQEEDRRKSKEAGFNGHLVKPVEHTALLRLLANHAPIQELGIR